MPPPPSTPPVPDPADPSPASIRQTGQQVQQQINVVGSAQFAGDPSSTEALKALTRALVNVRRDQPTEIEAIEAVFGEFQELASVYVVPDLQDFNPPEEANDPSLVVSRTAAFTLIDDFVGRPLRAETGNRVMLILGDAGMGKTSLLLMLKLRHLSQRWPGVKQCRLLKLGRDTRQALEDIPDPAHTVLLLDSLDEDPEALRSGVDADARMLALLPLLVRFQRCFLTCRTQFFPETSGHFVKAGHFKSGPYECALKYVSLFNDRQADLFLRARFRNTGWRRIAEALRVPGMEPRKLAAAQQVASAMGNLRMRPLLLSYADDFIGEQGEVLVDFRQRYAVYGRLVDQWLLREERKEQGLKAADGWRVAICLALHLAKRETYRIRREELATVPGLQDLPRFQLESRSLINRLSQGEYQFAHRTIQEFLLAYAIAERELGWDVTGIPITEEARRFLDEREAGRAARGATTSGPDLRGARVQAAGSAVRWVQERYGIEMLAVQPGKFRMGSPEGELGRREGETRHLVRLTRGFHLAKFVVTQAQWERVMASNPSSHTGADLPVTEVSWNHAQAFCQRLNEKVQADGAGEEGVEFRLPTEAEWEYACRAGTGTAFNDGSDSTRPEGKDPALDRLGWFNENSGGGVHPVGEKTPNKWGFHDFHGNVWEWCEDAYSREYPREMTDPIAAGGSGALRVVRGGSWSNQAGFCRAAIRDGRPPGFVWFDQGFRLAAGPRAQPGRGATPPR
jgi:formylglycine-generating enzyme required for sulfatase activity